MLNFSNTTIDTEELEQILTRFHNRLGRVGRIKDPKAVIQEHKDAYDEVIESVSQYVQAECDKAQENAVAWCVMVVDDLHISHTDMMAMDAMTDSNYKGIKNTIRARYEQEVGKDPAPDYPIKAQLQSNTSNKKEE